MQPSQFREETLVGYSYIAKQEARGRLALPRLLTCINGLYNTIRSAAIVISYLMKTKNMSYQEAFQLVQSKRPSIAPNRSFVEQLKRYETQLAKERQKKLKLQTKMLLVSNTGSLDQASKLYHRPSLPPPIHRGKLTNSAKMFQHIYQPRITSVTLS